MRLGEGEQRLGPVPRRDRRQVEREQPVAGLRPPRRWPARSARSRARGGHAPRWAPCRRTAGSRQSCPAARRGRRAPCRSAYAGPPRSTRRRTARSRRRRAPSGTGPARTRSARRRSGESVTTHHHTHDLVAMTEPVRRTCPGAEYDPWAANHPDGVSDTHAGAPAPGTAWRRRGRRRMPTAPASSTPPTQEGAHIVQQPVLKAGVMCEPPSGRPMNGERRGESGDDGGLDEAAHGELLRWGLVTPTMTDSGALHSPFCPVRIRPLRHKSRTELGVMSITPTRATLDHVVRLVIDAMTPCRMERSRSGRSDLPAFDAGGRSGPSVRRQQRRAARRARRRTPGPGRRP